MVEETTAAVHSLAKEADSLFELVSQFNIDASSTRQIGASVQLPLLNSMEQNNYLLPFAC